MIHEILRQVSIWVVLVPFLIGVINHKGLNNDSRWIFMLVIIAILPQLLTVILVKENGLLNACYNLYTPIEFFTLFKIFLPKYNEGTNRKIVQLSLYVYLAACTFFIVEYGLIRQFLNLLVCVNLLIYQLWILLLLKQEYATDHSLIDKSNPFAWYLLAIILYAPCTLIVFALYYYLRKLNNSDLGILWAIQSIGNILMYLLFSVGLLIRKPKNNP